MSTKERPTPESDRPSAVLSVRGRLDGTGKRLDAASIPEIVIKKFWDGVKIGTPDECWEWTARLSPKGYGVIPFNRRNLRAHRLSFAIHKGPIVPGALICHTCDNRACCNPGHLYLGTSLSNTDDRRNRGRTSNLSKTHCKNGHEFTEENTYHTTKGEGFPERRCRICARAYRAMYRATYHK
jgi:hypothetical protein